MCVCVGGGGGCKYQPTLKGGERRGGERLAWGGDVLVAIGALDRVCHHGVPPGPRHVSNRFKPRTPELCCPPPNFMHVF